MSLTYKQAYEQKDEILGLLKNGLQSKDIDKVVNFYLDLSDAHVAGAEWPSDLFEEEPEFVDLAIREIHTNYSFKVKIVEGINNGNL